MMKIFAFVLCVAFVAAAPQVDDNDDFELRKWNFIFFFKFIWVFCLCRLFGGWHYGIKLVNNVWIVVNLQTFYDFEFNISQSHASRQSVLCVLSNCLEEIIEYLVNYSSHNLFCSDKCASLTLKQWNTKLANG